VFVRNLLVEKAADFSQLQHMNILRILLLAIAAAGWAGCGPATPQKTSNTSQIPGLPTQAQPRLQTVKLWLGPEEMIAELAASPDQVRTGMMFRTNMAENESMLFDLKYPQQTGFWMPNCPLPLSVAYINPQGVVVEIHDLQPFNTNMVESASDNIQFALETRQGWYQRHNIQPGTVVRTERGSLIDTFSRKR
jgi:uncharacterized protein